MTAAWASDLFRRVAVPRLPGSVAVAAVEQLVTEQLQGFGYEVHREPFETATNRLRGVAAAGVGLGWCALALFPLLVLPIHGLTATLGGVAALALAAVVAAWIARGGGWSVDTVVTANNVVACRGTSIRLWLVAHSDSKAQRLSLRGRVFAFAALGIGAGGMLACLGLRVIAPLPIGVVTPWIGLTLIGAVGMAGPPLVGGSSGAVDNASGMIAALAAAEGLRERTDVGVLITGAEEFGMEGARVWVAGARRAGVFINFDGIDHVGSINIMVHARRHNAEVDSGPTLPQLLRALHKHVSAIGPPVRRSRLPLGIFVDGSVLAAGGMDGITLSRGDWSTLGVVHTARDTPERTSHESAVAVGEAVARAAAGLLS